jgi:hypothetical protein
MDSIRDFEDKFVGRVNPEKFEATFLIENNEICGFYNGKRRVVGYVRLPEGSTS